VAIHLPSRLPRIRPFPITFTIGVWSICGYSLRSLGSASGYRNG